MPLPSMVSGVLPLTATRVLRPLQLWCSSLGLLSPPVAFSVLLCAMTEAVKGLCGTRKGAAESSKEFGGTMHVQERLAVGPKPIDRFKKNRTEKNRKKTLNIFFFVAVSDDPIFVENGAHYRVGHGR